MTDKLIIITGPTASGKSDIAINVAKAFNGEIISADSQQIYKHMDIGTNKTKKYHGIAHHMLDIIEPTDDFTVEDYSKTTRILIKEINARGKIPIIAGGTGLYIDSILFDMNYGLSPKNEAIRKKLSNLAEDKGKDFIYEKLMKVDPLTANKYHPNETKRVIRALEIYETTGLRPSEVRTGEKKLNTGINPLIFFLNYEDRSGLYDKINKRVIEMIDEGLIEEFINLIENYGLDERTRALSAIGYKEIFPFVSNQISIDQLINDIQKNTRRYAKRQVTWMKRYLAYGFTHEIIMDNLTKTDASDIIISLIKDIYEF